MGIPSDPNPNTDQDAPSRVCGMGMPISLKHRLMSTMTGVWGDAQLLQGLTGLNEQTTVTVRL